MRAFIYLKCFLLSVFVISGLCAKAYAQGTYEEGEKAYLDQDYQKALSILLPLAENGHDDAQYYIGALYQYGDGVEQNLETALNWFIKSAELGDEDSQGRVGDFYRRGDGTSQSWKKAFKWYEICANSGSDHCQYYMGYMYEYGEGVRQSWKKAFEWYLKSAQQGDLDAQYRVATQYRDGDGVDEDAEKAFEWFLKSAEQGHVSSQLAVGVRYENGEVTDQDYGKAAYWYGKAAEQDNGTAIAYLGELYEKGRGVDRDIYKARELYKKAISMDIDYAKERADEFPLEGPAPQEGQSGSFQIGSDLFRNGNEQGAVKMFKQIAEEGDRDGQVILGVFYEQGQAGLTQSNEQAMYWYEKSAKQGHSGAQNNLASAYARGISGSADMEKARLWFTRAAENGVEEAKLNLANLDRLASSDPEAEKRKIIYDNALQLVNSGEHVAAKDLLLPNAQSGHGPSQQMLGALYTEGIGITHSQSEAFKWYLEAAKRGFTESQYQAGLAYRDGAGTEQSDEEAKRWLNLAANQSHEGAIKALNEMK